MTDASYETLKLERDGPVLHVVLNRPEVHDAFDERMIADLTRAFRRVEDDEATRVVLLRSTGKHFCAGADLDWMKRVGDYSEEENLADAGLLEDMLRSIARCPRPVIARVQGAALGGGAGLVCAADFAVASERAFLGFSEVRLGIAPAVISPYVLRKVGPGTAKALFLSGSRFGAGRAADLGLVHRVVPEEDLDDAVDELVDEILQGGPVAQTAIKQLVELVDGRTLSDAREFTTRTIADLRAGDEGKEGLSAFLEKRKPRWVPGAGDGEGEADEAATDDAEADDEEADDAAADDAATDAETEDEKDAG